MATRSRDGERLIDVLPTPALRTDVAGRIVQANPAALALLGCEAPWLLGRHRASLDAGPLPALPGGAFVPPGAQERRYRRPDGVLIAVREQVAELEDGALVVVHDLSEQVAARGRIEHLGTHDPLTNLPHRALLRRHLDTAAHGAAHRERLLLLVDLDHFGRVNDDLGHHLGDELLVAIAERLIAATGPGDLVARTGGDEFVVLLEGEYVGAGEWHADRVEAVRRAVRRPLVLHGRELAITASLGAVRWPANEHLGPDDVLRRAGLALHRAKEAGRDLLVWFEPDLLADDEDRLALAAALRQELDRVDRDGGGVAGGLGDAVAEGVGDGLGVVYQPQVDLLTGEIVGVEALARWTSAELGVVAPDRFIAVAEEGDMIDRLGDRVLRTACAAVVGLQERLGRPLRLAVNVSPRQLRRRSWLVEVAHALADADLDPSQLEIEITESLLVEDDERVVTALQTLRALGARVVVDDFGRGYSSLAYLTRLPIDRIKVDRHFVQQIGVAKSGEVVVDAIIVMAHALGLEVVAEGVETEAQERYLRARGCEEAQGFRYGAGVAASAVPGRAQAIPG